MVVLLYQQPEQVDDCIPGGLALHVADGGVLKELVAAACHTAIGTDTERCSFLMWYHLIRPIFSTLYNNILYFY